MNQGENTRTRGGWPIAIGMAVIYMGMMALMLVLATQPYSKAHLLMGDVWWQIGLMALVTVLIAWWTKLKIQRSMRVTWFSLLLIVPVLLAVGGLIYSVIIEPGTNWSLLIRIIIGTLFVGIGEEVAYRGVALNAIGQRATVNIAVLGSAVLFALLHTANMVSAPVDDVLPQVAMTFLIGLLFGWVYISTGGNLLLLIVLHWLYDAAVLGGPATGFGANWMGGIPPLLLYAIAIVASIVMFIRYRGRKYAETLP